MLIVSTRTTFVGKAPKKGETSPTIEEVAAGVPFDLDEAEAASLIERGLASAYAEPAAEPAPAEDPPAA